MFEVANSGERPVHIRGIGWRTGWVRWGPSFLKTKAAVQLTDDFGSDLGRRPPYELQPGASQSSYQILHEVLNRPLESGPFFTRDWPLFGRRGTRIRAYAYTADGHTVTIKPEKGLNKSLVKSEKRNAPYG